MQLSIPEGVVCRGELGHYCVYQEITTTGHCVRGPSPDKYQHIYGHLRDIEGRHEAGVEFLLALIELLVLNDTR